jgi:hypothetical protein
MGNYLYVYHKKDSYPLKINISNLPPIIKAGINPNVITIMLIRALYNNINLIDRLTDAYYLIRCKV